VTGWDLLYNRRTGAMSLSDARHALIVARDGTVTARENGNVVTARPDGSETAPAQNGLYPSYPARVDPTPDLERQGFLSEEWAPELAEAHRDRSLGNVDAVHALFKKSSVDNLNRAQAYDAAKQSQAAQQ